MFLSVPIFFGFKLLAEYGIDCCLPLSQQSDAYFPTTDTPAPLPVLLNLLVGMIIDTFSVSNHVSVQFNFEQTAPGLLLCCHVCVAVLDLSSVRLSTVLRLRRLSCESTCRRPVFVCASGVNCPVFSTYISTVRFSAATYGS